jgi:hypothetical protein
MKLLHRLQRRFGRGPAQVLGGLQPPLQHEGHDADGAVPPVPFDQIERLSDSGASLETLLELNRVQGW